MAIAGVQVIPVDLSDFASLKHVMQVVQPDAVIHAAAQSRPNYCQDHPEETARINVTAAWNIAGLCADRAIPCVFTSSELVFDGRHSPYRETDPVSPLSQYGEQKVAAEEGMLSRYPATAVCRMPLMFGVGSPVAQTFIQPMLRALRADQDVSLFVDEFRAPIDGVTAAQGLLLALAKVQGRVHLGGRERVSRYQFFQLLVDVLGLPRDRLRACQQADVPQSAPRPLDVWLDSSLALSLGFQVPSLRSQIQRLRQVLLQGS